MTNIKLVLRFNEIFVTINSHMLVFTNLFIQVFNFKTIKYKIIQIQINIFVC